MKNEWWRNGMKNGKWEMKILIKIENSLKSKKKNNIMKNKKINK